MQTLSTIFLILLVLTLGLAGYYYLDGVMPMQKTIRQLEKENEVLQAQLEQAQIQSQELTIELENRVNKVATEKNAEIQRLKNTYEELIAGLEEQVSSGEITITRLADQLKVNIVDRVLFPSGKAELTDRGRKVLLQVGTVLQKARDKHIKVEGHSDNVPIHPKLKSQFESNWELSVIRATNVVRFLETEVGLNPGNLEAAGFGPYRPVASNKTRRGRALNRRIEILLLPQQARAETGKPQQARAETGN
jgi:chemotaxis protein MotB